MNIQEAAKKYADELYAPNDRGVLYKESQQDFVEGAYWQKQETRRHAVEVCKQMCPSKVSRGCANLLHKRETKTTRCDGNCARVKYFINGLDKQEL